MNKILRYSFIVLLALVCGGAWADTTVTFTPGDPTSTTSTLEKGGVTITVTKGTSTSGAGALSRTDNYRFYKGNIVTFSSSSNITKIVVTATTKGDAQYGPGCFIGDGYTFEAKGNTGTWEGNSTSISLTASTNQVRATKIEVTIADGGVSKTSAGLAFSEETINHEVGTTFTAPTFSKATTATVTFASDNEEVATVNSEGTISLGSAEGKAVIKATSEENDTYYAGSATCTVYVYHMNVYKQATEVQSGKGYLLVAKRDGNTYYAMPVNNSGKNYGYANTVKLEEDATQIKIKSSYNDEFVFTAEGTTGYSVKDNNNKYYTQSGTFNSFQLADEPETWTVTPQSDGTFKIEMNGYYIQFGDGTYTSFGVYNEAKDNTVLPYLFELDSTSSSISEITTDATSANAPVYNLAGQKVSASYKGVVVKAGKKYIQK